MNKQLDSKKTETKPELYTLLGTVVSFPKNEIIYYQDYHFFSGIPTDVKFTVTEKSVHNDHWLIADGYGNLKKKNAYGNGAICVSDEHIIWALSQ